MQQATQMGMNRTGAQMAPKAVPQMKEAVEEFLPTSTGDETALESIRAQYIAEADPVGSVPMPGTVKGVLKTGVSKLTGTNPEVFIDKLGERLAFERGGTRLYEALMAKCSHAVGAAAEQVPPMAALERFRDEELRHFAMLTSVIESLGADPTAQTPCADVTGVQNMGVLQVVSDPRTTIAQCLNAVLTAELSDNAGWEMLIKLAEEAGQDQFATDFRRALDEENQHLIAVKQWLEDCVMAETSGRS